MKINDEISSVAHELDSQIPCIQHDEPIFPIFINPHSLIVRNINSAVCCAIIANFKNTYHGNEKMSTELLKNVRDILSVPLTYLISCMFSTGSVMMN